MIAILQPNPASLRTRGGIRRRAEPRPHRPSRAAARHELPARRRGQAQFAELWELESEHVLSRDVVSATFEAAGLGAVERPSREDNFMYTVMIYRGAAR
jgi:hypothetical protein